MLVKGEKDHIRIAFREIGDIKDIKIEDTKEEHVWSVTLSTKEDVDVREEVFYKMADIQCPILEMQSKKASLEEIFLELTEDDKKNKEDKKATKSETKSAAEAEELLKAQETDKKEGEDK